jgi:hypothetical protein
LQLAGECPGELMADEHSRHAGVRGIYEHRAPIFIRLYGAMDITLQLAIMNLDDTHPCA